MHISFKCLHLSTFLKCIVPVTFSGNEKTFFLQCLRIVVSVEKAEKLVYMQIIHRSRQHYKLCSTLLWVTCHWHKTTETDTQFKTWSDYEKPDMELNVWIEKCSLLFRLQQKPERTNKSRADRRKNKESTEQAKTWPPQTRQVCHSCYMHVFLNKRFSSGLVMGCVCCRYLLYSCTHVCVYRVELLIQGWVGGVLFLL